MFDVQPSPPSSLHLTLRGYSPAKAETILNALASHAQNLLRPATNAPSSSPAGDSAFEQGLAEAHFALSNAQARLQEFERTHNQKQAAETKAPDFDQAIASTQKKQEDLDPRIELLRSELQGTQAKIRVLTEEVAKQDPNITATREALQQALARYTEEHPKVRELRAALAKLEQEASAKQENQGGQAGSISLSANNPALGLHLQVIELRAQEVSTRTQLQNLLDTQSKLAADLDALEAARRTHERLRSEVAAYQDRLDRLQLTAKSEHSLLGFPGSVELGISPVTFAPPSHWLRLQTGALAGFGSGLLAFAMVGVGLALVARRRSTIQSVAELELITGLTTLNTLSNLRGLPKKSKDRWALDTFSMLKGRLATDDQRAFICGFTASARREGTSTCVRLLADAARKQGYYTVVLDLTRKKASKAAPRTEDSGQGKAEGGGQRSAPISNLQSSISDSERSTFDVQRSKFDVHSDGPTSDPSALGSSPPASISDSERSTFDVQRSKFDVHSDGPTSDPSALGSSPPTPISDSERSPSSVLCPPSSALNSDLRPLTSDPSALGSSPPASISDSERSKFDVQRSMFDVHSDGPTSDPSALGSSPPASISDSERSTFDVQRSMFDVQLCPPGSRLYALSSPQTVWDWQFRKQFQNALAKWSDLDNLAVFIDLPPYSANEGVMLVEKIPNLVWCCRHGCANISEVSDHMQTLKKSQRNLVGAIFNGAGNANQSRPGSGPRRPPKPQRRKSPAAAAAATMAMSLLLAFALSGGVGRAQESANPAPPPPPTNTAPPVVKTGLSAGDPADLAPWQQKLTLGPGDVLDISIYGTADSARRGLIVGPDGRLNYLQARDILASGQTVDELRAALEKALEKYYLAPRIVINPIAYNSKKYYLLGNVMQKGAFILDRPTSIIEAIAKSGGFVNAIQYQNVNLLVDLERSFLVRKKADSTYEKIEIDFESLFLRGDLSQNLPLTPDDYLFFPESGRQEVYVLGETRSQGLVPYSKDLTALGAIAARGGFGDKAWKSKVLVIRGSLHDPQKIIVDASDLLKGKGKDMQLQNRDIVYVHRKPWAKAEELLGYAALSFARAVAIGYANQNVGPFITEPFLQ